MAQQSSSNEAKLAAAQTIYESDYLMGQYLSLHFGPMDAVYREFAAETGAPAGPGRAPPAAGPRAPPRIADRSRAAAAAASSRGPPPAARPLTRRLPTSCSRCAPPRLGAQASWRRASTSPRSAARW
jgi:hypothetical protein